MSGWTRRATDRWQDPPRFQPGPGYDAQVARQEMRSAKLGGYSKKDALGSVAESWGPPTERVFGMFQNVPDPPSRSTSPYKEQVDPEMEVEDARIEALKRARAGTQYEQYGSSQPPRGHDKPQRLERYTPLVSVEPRDIQSGKIRGRYADSRRKSSLDESTGRSQDQGWNQSKRDDGRADGAPTYTPGSMRAQLDEIRAVLRAQEPSGGL